MANRTKPPFKPTIATVSQLEQLEQGMIRALTEFGTRLGITEFAVNQLISDFYYPDGEGAPEDEASPELPAVAVDPDNPAHEMDLPAFDELVDDAHDREIAEWENEGGAHVD